MRISTPCMLSLGKLMPISTMMALVSVSKTVILPPISPRPPSGVMRILCSLEFRYFSGSSLSSWVALFASIALAISCCHCSLPFSFAGKFFFGFLAFLGFSFCSFASFLASAFGSCFGFSFCCFCSFGLLFSPFLF